MKDSIEKEPRLPMIILGVWFIILTTLMVLNNNYLN